MSADAAPAPAPPDQDVRRERALAAPAVESGSALAALAEHSGNALAVPVCGSYESARLLAVDWRGSVVFLSLGGSPV
jgi:hypothetical protein